MSPPRLAFGVGLSLVLACSGSPAASSESDESSASVEAASGSDVSSTAADESGGDEGPKLDLADGDGGGTGGPGDDAVQPWPTDALGCPGLTPGGPPPPDVAAGAAYEADDGTLRVFLDDGGESWWFRFDLEPSDTLPWDFEGVSLFGAVWPSDWEATPNPVASRLDLRLDLRDESCVAFEVVEPAVPIADGEFEAPWGYVTLPISRWPEGEPQPSG